MAVMARNPASTTAPVAINADEIKDRAFGFTAATLIGGGFGTAFLGILTLISELFVSTQPALNLIKPVGPLSGKAIYGVIGWLVGSALLAVLFRGRNVSEVATYWITGILIAVGFVLTFPLTWKLLGA